VGTSWYGRVNEFKSPLHVIAAFLLRSRETQLAKVTLLSQQVAELQSQLERQQQELEQKQEEIDTLTQRAFEAEKQRDQAKQSVNLPEDPPIGTHGYGARMISLAVNLARSVGFRGAARTLQVFFQWLGIDRALPSRTSICNWLRRLGIDEMKQPLDSSESLVIMVDHSNQIGAEKVMLALGVNAAAMPEPGKALTHEDVRVLEVKPGDSWKTADMEKEYEALAERYGAPRAVLVDGAVELREGAKCLKNLREDTIVLRLRGQCREVAHWQRRTVRGGGRKDWFHAFVDPANRTRPPDSTESEAKSSLHESVEHACMADDDLVAVKES